MNNIKDSFVIKGFSPLFIQAYLDALLVNCKVKKISVSRPEGRNNLEDLDLSFRIIFKWI
jgi:hypothetical protein